MAHDDRSMQWAVRAGAALCLLAMGYAILQDPLFAAIGTRVERRRHYEQKIVKKGLRLHPATDWTNRK